jgi:hypothetical protein
MWLMRRRRRGERVAMMSELVPVSAIPCPRHLLDHGEKAIWWDRPDKKRYALRGALFNIPFFLFYTGFSALWINGTSKAGGNFWIFGLPFLSAGLWMLGEPVRRFYQAKSIIYLLTDKRAIISSSSKHASHALASMRSIDSINLEGSKGDLLFIDQPPYGYSFLHLYSLPDRDGFIGITDPEKIGREMRRLQSAT